MDMRYQWLTNRVRQNNLTFIGDQDVKISVIITKTAFITASQRYARINIK
jgi:hypothetical protein